MQNQDKKLNLKNLKKEIDVLTAAVPSRGKPAVCRVAISPIRAEPSDAAEIVSQILFGELLEILQIHPTKPLWAQVRCEFDGYLGWLDIRQTLPVSDEYFAEARENYALVADLTHVTQTDSHFQLLTMGARLPLFDGISFWLGDQRFSFSGQAVFRGQVPTQADWAVRLAHRYYFSPYLWGGRSPLGIDCSGFTQSVFHFLNVRLLRDASMQVNQGDEVGFIENSQAGDLAFFDNAKGKITHVGIVLSEGRIIHASGHVRVDLLDHQGIFNEERGEYSHQLRIIKRLLPKVEIGETTTQNLPPPSIEKSQNQPNDNQIQLF